MAFDGGVKGRFRCGVAAQNIVQGVDNTVVAAAVSVSLFHQVGNRGDFTILSVLVDGERAGVFVSNDFTKRTLELITSAPHRCKR